MKEVLHFGIRRVKLFVNSLAGLLTRLVTSLIPGMGIERVCVCVCVYVCVCGPRGPNPPIYHETRQQLPQSLTDV